MYKKQQTSDDWKQTHRDIAKKSNYESWEIR